MRRAVPTAQSGPVTTTSPPDLVVDVRGLRKSYGDRVVVDDLDLDVRAGEVLGLIGANGAGKTTTVECLQGLRRPDAGTCASWASTRSRDADRLRPQVGSQLQSSGLPDRMRVVEAVRLFSGPDAARRRRAARAVRPRPPAPLAPSPRMSGGERQRLFLVLALLEPAPPGDPRRADPGPGPGARGARSGRRSRSCATPAPPSCWSPTSSPRPRRCATGWWPCAPAGCSTQGTPRRAGRPARRRRPHVRSRCRPAGPPSTSPRCAGCPASAASIAHGDHVAVRGDRRRRSPTSAPGWSRRGRCPSDLARRGPRPRERPAPPARRPARTTPRQPTTT